MDYRPSKYTIDTVRSTDNAVIDNYIHDIGALFYDSCGIVRGYTYNTLIAYNSIMNVSYDAISAGWGWGHGGLDMNATTDQFKYGVFTGNAIVCNYIFNAPSITSDSGSIYTLGRQQDMIIEGNYINGSTEQGIYLDGLSNGITVTHNVLENVARNFVTRGQENHVYENHISGAPFASAIQPELGGQVYVDYTNCSEEIRLSVIRFCGVRIPFDGYTRPTA